MEGNALVGVNRGEYSSCMCECLRLYRVQFIKINRDGDILIWKEYFGLSHEKCCILLVFSNAFSFGVGSLHPPSLECISFGFIKSSILSGLSKKISHDLKRWNSILGMGPWHFSLEI